MVRSRRVRSQEVGVGRRGIRTLRLSLINTEGEKALLGTARERKINAARGLDEWVSIFIYSLFLLKKVIPDISPWKVKKNKAQHRNPNVRNQDKEYIYVSKSILPYSKTTTESRKAIWEDKHFQVEVRDQAHRTRIQLISMYFALWLSIEKSHTDKQLSVVKVYQLFTLKSQKFHWSRKGPKWL